MDIRYKDDLCIVSFAEPRVIGIPGVEVAEQQLRRAIDTRGAKKMVLDLEGVDYLSSAMLGVIVRLQKRLRSSKGGLRLCNVNETLFEKIFRISALDRFLDIRPSLDDALASLTSSTRPRAGTEN